MKLFGHGDWDMSMRDNRERESHSTVQELAESTIVTKLECSLETQNTLQSFKV